MNETIKSTPDNTSTILEDSIKNKYDAHTEVETFSASDKRKFHFNAVMAKIEETSLSPQFKTELQFHYEEFLRYNND